MEYQTDAAATPQWAVTGSVVAADQKTHRFHTLDVPPAVRQIAVRLEFDPGPADGLRNMICLSVFDPQRFRGSGHRGGTLHSVVISPTAATPGYLAGALPPGRWTIALHVHRIVAACPCRLSVEWTTGEGAPGAASAAAVAAPGVPTAGRWLRGDLHLHTTHSDGGVDRDELVAQARACGLDFIAITDHNTVSHLVPAGSQAGCDRGLLVVAGMELTTFRGHALSLGTREWIDWGILDPRRGMRAIAADVRKHGGLFVIAHPRSVGDPECTGCDWRFDDMMPGTAPAVEVWNGDWAGDSNNEAALTLWYQWLAEGRRIVATAGSDSHSGIGDRATIGTNVVYATECSEPAILEAVGLGHLYLSSGPHSELVARAADSGRQIAVMGDACAAAGTIVAAAWRHCPADSVVRLLVDGRVAHEEPVTVVGEGSHEWTDLACGAYVLEVRAADGCMLALTNPIYLG